jgi:surface antigen
VISRALIGLKILRNQVRYRQKNIAKFIKERRTVEVLHLFRNYSAFIVVVSSSLLVSATNLAAGRESSGFLFGYFGESESYENPLKDMFFVKAAPKTSVALAPLAEAKTIPNPEAAAKNNEEEPMMIQGQSLVAGTSPVRKDPEEDGGVIIYEVATGDTVGAIAEKHKISINTILWSNELDNVNSIMPGDKLFIMPVSGLKHTVKKGDDIGSIAKQYKADESKIIAFNDLPANGKIKEGQEITIPDGQKEIPKPKPTAETIVPSRPYESFGKILSGKAGTGHKFPYGYCTWYVSQRKYVPWGGNAGTWLYHAKASGYATGRTPQIGSIIVTSESWWGHVGIVEKVSGSSITISEMNYKGFGVKSTRTLSSGSRVIKGYIY